ncbi:MAG: MogA/MoaB family molybdenum cofactor biosynthesis protein [Spirochaetota bacterium]
MSDALRVLVVTVSDRASRGIYEDRSGPAVEAALRELISEIEIKRSIVPDEPEELRAAFTRGLSFDSVVTTGGTGIGPRDITPEITRTFCDRDLPGIAELIRSEGRSETPMAALSRGCAAVKDHTVFVNLPGSVGGATSGARLIAPLLEHAKAMLQGGGH